MRTKRKIDPSDQPTECEKRRVLNGEESVWEYQFDPGLLLGTQDSWSHDDWIRFIGTNWFRKS